MLNCLHYEPYLQRNKSCYFSFYSDRMASQAQIIDVFDEIEYDDSDVASSGDEYVPHVSDMSDSDGDVAPSTSTAAPTQAKKRKRLISSDHSDDDIPLSSLREKLVQQREEDDLEIISQMLEEPVWEDVPMATVDTTFKGVIEQAPENGLKTPYEFFRELITDAMLNNVEMQSNNYALSKSGIELKTAKKEVEIFIGLYLRMGLMKGYCVRAYWANETRYPPVADEMSRNRFELLARHIHFCDNTAITDEAKKADRIWKVRTWVEGFRESLTKITPQQKQSVDEVMVAFKGRSGLKQYLRNKPRKWGFKLWARAGCDGIVHDFDIYQGKTGSTVSNSGLGMTGDVVMNMVEKLPDSQNFIIFADNLFSSLKLVQKLKDKGFWFVGTVRENRLKGCELKKERDLKKEERGSMDSKLELNSNVMAVRWFDNRKVDLISSCIGTEPVAHVSRYDKKKKEIVKVPCPAIVHEYNKHMGGVDLLDSLTSLYKYSIKSRRWYLYIFFHTVNMAVVSAWLWYRRHCGLLNVPYIQLSDFQAQVASGCIKSQRLPGRPSSDSFTPPGNSRPLNTEHRPISDIRLDQVAHLPQWTKRGRCKAACPGFTFVFCAKCEVHLCFNKDRNCFSKYHTK